METVAYCLKASYIDENGNTVIGYVVEPNSHNYHHNSHVKIIREFLPYEIIYFSEEKYAKYRAPEIKEALKKYYNIFSISIHEICIKN